LVTKDAGGARESNESMGAGAKGVVLLGDDPVTGLASDAFGRGPFADRVVQLLDNLAEETPSAVLGLLGPWGSGKTSVLNVLREKLDGHGDWQVVDLNPWMVADVPSMIDEFFITLVSKIPSTKKGKAVRKKMAGYAGAVAPVTSVLKVVGVDAEGALRGVEDMLKGDQSLEARRKELEEALRDYGKPVLMIADDLDRLQPDELLQVFKLVRLLGRLPNTYYLLAFDERTASDVIRSTDLASGDAARAHAYLEKVIQIRLDMPLVRPKQVTNLINHLLGAVCTRHSVSLDVEATSRLSESFRIYMSAQMTQPRQVKRYFAQLEAMWPLVADEVDFVDFAIVTFLRTFHPAVVDVLIRHRGELTGSDWDVAFERPSHETVADRWRERLAGANAPAVDVDPLLRLLSGPFLVIQGALHRMEYSGYGAERAEQKRVDSIEYFDRYFHLGVGDGEVADAIVHAALAELTDGNPGTNWDTVLEAIDDNADFVYSKLSRFAPEDPAAAETLAPHVAELAKRGADPNDFGRPPPHLRHWLSKTIEHARPVDIDTFIDTLADIAGTDMIVQAANSMRLRAKDLPGPRPANVDAVLAASAKRLLSELEDQASLPPAETRGVGTAA
jgi:hypothetical protein